MDTLFPATLVLRRLMELVGRDELILCDKAIREGIIFDFIVRHRERIKAEADMPAGHPRETEMIGIVPFSRIPVRGCEEKQHLGAFGQDRFPDRHRSGRGSDLLGHR